jgi:D-3-phosphoglycerate dehydrogenase / 2-oxoglutarate reductase
MAAASKQKVLVSQPIHESGMRVLTEKFEARVASDASEATLIREVRDCAGLLVRTAPIPASVIEASAGLKVIARHGVGYDNIDVAAATRRNIPVCITPRANALSVAEHVLAFMLAWAKRIVPYDAATRKNDWEIRNSYGAFDLDGKTFGILGMGRIGMLVCQKAKAAFNMEVLAYDPLVPKEAMEKAGARVATIPEILKASDFVTVHVPSNPETKGMIGEAQFKMMKRSAFLINCARGPIVDEAALVTALKGGVIAGAGLDVFDPEPPKGDNPLFGLPNVLLSPHSAGLTVECVIRMATHAAQAIVDVLEGRRPEGIINPEAMK